MPTKPRSICKSPLCSSHAERGMNGYCATHSRKDLKAQDALRAPASQRGYTHRWHAVRTLYLHEHPLCVECLKQGRPVPATVVDHIKPHKGDQRLFWDETNWQSLCKPCHDAKTAREDGGFGNGGKPLKEGGRVVCSSSCMSQRD
jgi:5-methylcytosine-specific restriction protein A